MTSVLEKGVCLCVCVCVCVCWGEGCLALEITRNFENSRSSKYYTINVSTLALTRGSYILFLCYGPATYQLHLFTNFVLVQSRCLKAADSLLFVFSTRSLLNSFCPNTQIAYWIS